MNILSCFDGMSCARIALDRLGIPVTNYFASEIDRYAIQTSKANWNDITHIGDVTKVHYFEGVLYTEFGSYKVNFSGGLICGGSPCQGFSFAGKQLNFEDPRSKLFFEFVRIYEEIKAEHPTVKVFLENVLMKKEYQAVISEKLGLQPVMINSALVSAQNRKRLYWTDIPFQGQPKDRGVLLKDILEDNCTTVLRWQNKNSGAVLDDQKGATLRASGGTDIRKRMKVVDFGNQIALSEKEIDYTNREVSDGRTHWDFGHHSDSDKDKSPALTANVSKGVPYNVLIDRTKCIQVGMASDIKAPTLTANSGGNQETKITGGALRGRLEDGTYVQKFEDNGLEKSNSLTTVDKDSLVTIYPASIIGRKLNQNGKRDDYNPDVPITQCLQVKHSADKTGCLTTVDKDNVVSTMPPGRYEDVYNTPHITYRKLTVTECERLQGVPDGYCQRLSAEKKQVSNSQSYKMLGNGWQVDTIVHLFEPLLWMDII